MRVSEGKSLGMPHSHVQPFENSGNVTTFGFNADYIREAKMENQEVWNAETTAKEIARLEHPATVADWLYLMQRAVGTVYPSMALYILWQHMSNGRIAQDGMPRLVWRQTDGAAGAWITLAEAGETLQGVRQ